MHAAPQRKSGSPQSNYPSCFRMQIRVIKSTKQLKMQMERSLLLVKHLLGGKEMKHFHQSFASCFLRGEQNERFVCFLFEELLCKSLRGSEAFPGARGSTKALCLRNIHVFCWFSSLPCSSAGKERLESGETSEPKWRVYSCG